MSTNRRDFLKTSLVAGTAAAASPVSTAHAGLKAAGKGARFSGRGMAKGLILLNFVQRDRDTLGVKTEKGILDVVRAGRAFKASAPESTDEVVQDGDKGLGALVAQAVAKGGRELFLDE